MTEQEFDFDPDINALLDEFLAMEAKQKAQSTSNPSESPISNRAINDQIDPTIEEMMEDVAPQGCSECKRNKREKIKFQDALDNIQDRLASSEEENKQYRHALDETEDRLANLEEELETLREIEEDASRELLKANGGYAATQKLLKESEAKVTELQNKLDKANGRSSQWMNSLQSHEKSETVLKKQIKQLNLDSELLHARLKNAKIIVGNRQQELDRLRHQQNNSLPSGREAKLLAEINEKETRIQTLLADEESKIKGLNDRLDQEHRQHTQQTDQLTVEKRRQCGIIVEGVIKSASLQTTLDNERKAKELAEQAANSATRTLAEARDEIQRLQARVSSEETRNTELQARLSLPLNTETGLAEISKLNSRIGELQAEAQAQADLREKEKIDFKKRRDEIKSYYNSTNETTIEHHQKAIDQQKAKYEGIIQQMQCNVESYNTQYEKNIAALKSANESGAAGVTLLESRLSEEQANREEDRKAAQEILGKLNSDLEQIAGALNAAIEKSGLGGEIGEACVDYIPVSAARILALQQELETLKKPKDTKVIGVHDDVEIPSKNDSYSKEIVELQHDIEAKNSLISNLREAKTILPVTRHNSEEVITKYHHNSTVTKLRRQAEKKDIETRELLLSHVQAIKTISNELKAARVTEKHALSEKEKAENLLEKKSNKCIKLQAKLQVVKQDLGKKQSQIDLKEGYIKAKREIIETMVKMVETKNAILKSNEDVMEFQNEKLQTKEKDIESKDKSILTKENEIKELKKKIRYYQRAVVKEPLEGIGLH